MKGLRGRLIMMAAVVFACVGCDEQQAEPVSSTRWSTWELAAHTTRIDERIGENYAELLAIEAKRGELRKRIDRDGSERYDNELKRGDERIAELEQYVSRFETHIGVCRVAVDQLKLHRKKMTEASCYEDIDRAATALPQVKKRLAAIKAAWLQYRDGKPLPPQV